MDKEPLTEATIQRTAKSLREEAIDRLNEGITTPSIRINSNPPRMAAFRRQSKRDEALITCIVLASVVALSTLIQPMDWRLAIGCLCSGIGMALGGLLERKGYVDFSVVVFLIATGVFVWAAAKFGAKGPMIWAQSLPLTGIGAFGAGYVLFDKFGFKEQDISARSNIR